MLFFGWEGVGLASYALIGFWYYDRKKDFVGVQGHIAGGIPMWTSPTHAGMKAFLMTRAGDVMMLAGMFLIFIYAGTFDSGSWPKTQHGRSQCRSKTCLSLQPSCSLAGQ